MSSSDKVYADEDKKKIIDEAWLGLDVDDNKLFNPMDFLDFNDNDVHHKLSYLMSRPEYFSFLCKHIFNLQILPSQALMLNEFWNRKFPMLIASRGYGKSFMLSLYAIIRALLLPRRKVVVVGAAFRQSKVLFEYIETIWNNSPILRDICDSESGPRRDTDRCVMKINESRIICLPLGDGCLKGDSLVTYEDRIGVISDPQGNVWGNEKFREVDHPYDNGVRPTKVIKTHMGFEYESTFNHKMKVARNNEIEWVEAEDVVEGDRILIDKSERWHNGVGAHSTEDYYTLGCMIGDGNYTDAYHLGFTTKDVSIVENLTLPFKQMSDKVHWKVFGKDTVSEWKNKWGVSSTYTKDKIIPDEALKCDKTQMSALLRGLFDTDGHVVHSESRGSSTYVGFTNTSKRLVQQIQYILLHYGIVSKVKERNRNDNWNLVYELLITGKDVVKFKQIGFGLERKQKLLDKVKNDTKNRDSVPVDANFLVNNKSSDCSYCDSQILRKKSFTSDFVKHVSPVVSEKFDVDNTYYDTVVSISDSECHTYDIYVPEGNEYCANGFHSHNTKIRGQRANDIIADEFASIPREIFETVVAGFAAVSSNPIENVKRLARIKKAAEMGIEIEDSSESRTIKDNQIILSGTAYYDFNHFAEYWKKWCAIIKSKGDTAKLRETVFNGEDPPEDFDWEQYSVIRIPYEMIPAGFMDAAQVARSKATIHSGLYQMEFGAVFTKDSQGFFKRSLIEQCVANDQAEIFDMDGNPIRFSAKLIGDPKKKYVFGVDPASEVDNFSIVVLELNGDHRRIVYCWTTRKSEHTDKLKRGLSTEKNFYAYCARKLRDLMKLFPCEHIATDAQGGGVAIREALRDTDKIQTGEMPILEIIDKDKPKDTDKERGLHILEMCQFAKFEWLAEANHGLRKDFEDRVLLFPEFDAISLGVAEIQDTMKNRGFDNLEECMMDIEELKDELAMIQMTQTAAGRDKWDTPEIIVAAGKKDKMRKDRYSALLCANMAARIIDRTPPKEDYEFYGGFAVAKDPDAEEDDENLFVGNPWFSDRMRDVY